MCQYCVLLGAIERYIAKAEDDLSQSLGAAGYADAKNTVIKIGEFEEILLKILEEEDKAFLDLLSDAVKNNVEMEEFMSDYWPEFKVSDRIKSSVKTAYYEKLSECLPAFVGEYVKVADPELVAGEITKRTTNWISSWSEELADIMQLSSNDEIEKVLTNTLKDGTGIGKLTSDIMQDGIRNTPYKARRVAVTEILRAHSVAQEESIQQVPAVEEKEWVHTGSYKNQPRFNHVNMNGQRVKKTDPFELVGRDGTVYYPMFPRDPILPAAEAVSCHCIHRGIVSEEILGLPLEERKQLQEQAIAEMDDAWEAELDARNRARAGIE